MSNEESLAAFFPITVKINGAASCPAAPLLRIVYPFACAACP
jgi:hypothetical protein